jgi:bisphosphoglycerate-independent phosphoglycerate mutase (AlkP superfamily)
LANIKNSPLVLIVLDGFGYTPERTGTIALARTPHFDG